MSTAYSMARTRERIGGERRSVPPGPHRIVVVGGGAAGMEVVTKLAYVARRGAICVTLIDREPAHVWKPMLHTIAAGTSDVSQQETHYMAHALRHGYRFEPGELQNVDREARTVRLAPVTVRGRAVLPTRDIPYDTLILAIGSQANDFGILGVREHCFMLDSRSQALAFNREVQTRMMQSFGTATPLRISVVGAGATGVELCAELI